MGLPSQAPLPLTALPLSNSPHQEHPPAPAWGCSGHLLPHRAPPTLTLEFYPVFFFFNITIVFKPPPPNIFCPLSNVIPQRHCSSADWLSCAQCQVLQSYLEHARTCPSWQGPASTSPHSTFLLSWSQLPFSRIPKTGHRVTASFQNITKKKNKP